MKDPTLYWSLPVLTVILMKLTCPAEENIRDAQLRKEVKYTPLKNQIKDNDWKCHLWTIEVGVRGFAAALCDVASAGWVLQILVSGT